MSSARAAIGALGLALLALSFAPSFQPREIRARLDASRDPGFAFDREYRSFLEAVERATPPGATVAVFTPTSAELYLHQAAYQLAPRRIVGKELSVQAQYLAVYRRGKAPPIPASAVAVPGGFLLKR
ncbi:MAG: hypothetical protein ABI968_06665 [Acidobacteriota bacterium]